MPLALAAYVVARRRRRRYAVRFTGAPTLAALVGTLPAWRRHLPAAVFAAALTALALALARPQATVAVPIEQASVLLVTDVSGSMQATDVEPTRLDAARKAALDFLDDVPDEVRVGAVAYSTVPHTLDRPGTDRSTCRGPHREPERRRRHRHRRRARPGARAPRPPQGPRPDRRRRSCSSRTGRPPPAATRSRWRPRRAGHGCPIYTVALGTSEGVIETSARAAPRASGPRDDARDRAACREVAPSPRTTPRDSTTCTSSSARGSATKPEPREITAGFAAGGLVLLLTAAGLAVRGVGRLP